MKIYLSNILVDHLEKYNLLDKALYNASMYHIPCEETKYYIKDLFFLAGTEEGRDFWSKVHSKAPVRGREGRTEFNLDNYKEEKASSSQASTKSNTLKISGVNSSTGVFITTSHEDTNTSQMMYCIEIKDDYICLDEDQLSALVDMIPMMLKEIEK